MIVANCGDLAAYALLLMEGIKLQPSVSGVLWRGMRMSKEVFELYAQNTGKVIVFPAVISFSESMSFVTTMMAGRGPATNDCDVLVVLLARNRHLVQGHARYAVEREVLLPPGSVVFLKSVVRDDEVPIPGRRVHVIALFDIQVLEEDRGKGQQEFRFTVDGGAEEKAIVQKADRISEMLAKRFHDEFADLMDGDLLIDPSQTVEAVLNAKKVYAVVRKVKLRYRVYGKKTAPKELKVRRSDRISEIIKQIGQGQPGDLLDGECELDREDQAGNVLDGDTVYTFRPKKKVAPLSPEAVRAYQRAAPEYFSPDEPRRAASLLKKAADLGHPEAAVLYGECLRDGRGVAEDKKAAAALFQSVVPKSAAGKAAYGLCLVKGWGVPSDPPRGAALAREAAESKDPAAEGVYGYLLHAGEGVAQDLAAGVALLRKAAEAGNPTAAYHLGECYRLGRHYAKNNAQAVAWYEKGAQRGCVAAMLQLAECHTRGIGTPKDSDEAEHWFAKASAAGSAAAAARCKELGIA